MKKIVLGIMLVSMLTGCALFTSPGRPGYQAGRTTAVIWLATEDIQPVELHDASMIGYKMLREIYIEKQFSSIDLLIEAGTKKALDDATLNPAQKILIGNFMTMAKNRFNNEVYIDIADKTIIIGNFINGINDALSDYSASE